MQAIKHIFNGEEREFRINPKSVWGFERAMGRSLFAILRSFTSGTWTFDDIANVLSFALHGPNKEMRQAMVWAADMARFGGTVPISYVAHPGVVEALQAAGHGNYADLAAQILSAAIFGENAEVADVE